MTIPLGRLAMAYSPRRLPAHSRRASTSSTQLRSKPTPRAGRNLGLRYHQLESSVRSTIQKVALLEEATDTARSVEQYNSLSVSNESRAPREGMEMFHGLVVPQEPKPPESDGEFFAHSFILILILKRLVFRMLHVRMCNLRLRCLRGLSLDVQSVACFVTDTAEIHGDPSVGMALTNRVFTGFSGRPTTAQHKY